MSFRIVRRESWLIAVAVLITTVASPSLPDHLELGSLLALAALALLLQGLIRDLAILARHPPPDTAATAPHALPCICVESAIGLPVIFIGVGLSACNLPLPIALRPWAWPVGATAIWTAGYLAKDIVLTWGPWGFRRVADHGSILVQWRRR